MSSKMFADYMLWAKMPKIACAFDRPMWPICTPDFWKYPIPPVGLIAYAPYLLYPIAPCVPWPMYPIPEFAPMNWPCAPLNGPLPNGNSDWEMGQMCNSVQGIWGTGGVAHMNVGAHGVWDNVDTGGNGVQH